MGRRKSNREAGQLHNNQPTKLATLVWPANDVDRRRIHLDFRSSLTITTHTQPHIDPSPPVESTHWSSSIVHSSRTCSRARGMAGQSGGIRQSAALTAAVHRVGSRRCGPTATRAVHGRKTITCCFTSSLRNCVIWGIIQEGVITGTSFLKWGTFVEILLNGVDCVKTIERGGIKWNSLFFCSVGLCSLSIGSNCGEIW